MDKTCADRIREHLDGRLEDISKILAAAHVGDDDEWYEYPLGVEKETIVKVELSTGGPADWFECSVYIDGYGGVEIQRIVYHFSDWFDHAERVLQGDEFNIAEEFCQPFADSAAWGG